MSDRKVGIVDYGMGNLFNIARVFESIDCKAEVTDLPESLKLYDHLIIPGVGAFEKAINNLNNKNLSPAIHEFVKTGKPVIGICLGMQLLFEKSFEFGIHDGLGLIKGNVLKFDFNGNRSIKIPQIGWNSVKYKNDKTDPAFKGIPDSSFYYFIHSYYCAPDEENDYVGLTQYGDNLFCSVARKDNVLGCQFHPERSGTIGVKIFQNFISL